MDFADDCILPQLFLVDPLDICKSSIEPFVPKFFEDSHRRDSQPSWTVQRLENLLVEIYLGQIPIWIRCRATPDENRKWERPVQKSLWGRTFLVEYSILRN